MTLTGSALTELRSALRGAALTDGDPGYDESRQVWNGMIDRRPAVIAMCETKEDIAAAIHFAREHGLIIAIRGGGHSAAGSSVCDGGMMLNLRRMNQVTVDPVARRATAGAGATWFDFDTAAGAHGLATTGGAVATTGIAGLTLGGGLGWLMRSKGLTIDNLESVEMVTANGEFVRASEDENTELFWGLRGGGGNFGVVSSFTYRLHHVTTVLGGSIVHRIDRYAELLKLYREITASAPDELTVYFGGTYVEGAGTAAGFYLCYSGSPEEGERLIRPLRAFDTPLSDNVAVRPYAVHQTLTTDDYPHGRRYYRRSNWITGITDGVIDALDDATRKTPTRFSTVYLEHAGGAVKRRPYDSTAFSHRDVEYDLLTVAAWEDPADTDRCIEWTKEAWAPDAITWVTRGVYVNYLGYGEGQDRVRLAYGPAIYDRLVDLKRKWDPENTFRMNPNIDPAGV